VLESERLHSSFTPPAPGLARCGICQTRRSLHEDGGLPPGWYQSPAAPEWLACPECQIGLLEAARAGRIYALPPDEVPGA
jgi:hypothetical protein